MPFVNIDGAELFESEGTALKRRTTLHSPDRQRLAVVSEGSHGRFYVHIYERMTDRQYSGVFWGEASHQSITDSLDAAEHLARARLEHED